MTIKSTILSALFLFCFCFYGNAQDPYFAQFYTSPLQLSPAMIGVYNGQFRVVANYRDQWSSVLGNNPFRTMSASFDYRSNVNRNDYLAFGITAMRDEVDISKYVQQRGSAGLSYLKQLSGNRYRSSNQYLVAGLQAGFGQHALDWSGLWFSQQYDNGNDVVDTSLDSGEAMGVQRTNAYLDVNAGLLWYAVFDENQSFYVGAALHHVNSPNVSFLGQADEVLHTRWTAHLGGELPLNDNLSVLPAAMVTHQNKSMNILAGMNFRYTNRDWREIAIRAGLWGQVSNQLEGLGYVHTTFTAILEMERWNFGVSYDINSNITPATNSRGAFELSLIYTKPERRRVRVKCPNF